MNMYKSFNQSRFEQNRLARSYWNSLSSEEKNELTTVLRESVKEELVRHLESTLNHKLENK
jgi:nitric oxide synthase oxygenase domain/subunit